MSIENNTTPTELNEIKLPLDGYMLRVIECDKATSKKGNPMLVIKAEVVDHPGLSVNGEQVDINGITLNHWVTLMPKTLGIVNTFHKSVGMPIITESDLSHIDPLMYKGLKFPAVCESVKTEMKGTDGTPVINPATGEQVITYNRNVKMVLSR